VTLKTANVLRESDVPVVQLARWNKIAKVAIKELKTSKTYS